MPRTEPGEGRRAGNPARRRAILWVLFGLAVVIHLASLYLPSAGTMTTFPGADKIAHVLLFAGVVAPALLLRLPAPLVISAAIAHAGISEMVQLYWIPGRDGSGWDMAANLVGIGVGIVLARLLRRASVRATSRSRLR